MIFETGKDIEKDIKDRISLYLKDNEDVSLKSLSSILFVYLQELKNIGELKEFHVSSPGEETFFTVFYIKDDIIYDFNISLIIEMRNIKIEKIKSNKIISYEIL